MKYTISTSLDHIFSFMQSGILQNNCDYDSSSSFVTRRLINEHTTIKFKNNLGYECWAHVFNINVMFNNFLNTFLRIFNNSFPYNKFILTHTKQPWLTIGIKVSCIHKRELYLLSRNLNDSELTRYYKNYCKILTEVMKLAKQCYYNKLISNSNNKIKTTWCVIRSITNTKLEKIQYEL
jgi:hypothetical protein